MKQLSLSENRPSTKDTIKELNRKGMTKAAKGHQSLLSAERRLTTSLARLVARDGDIAKDATTIYNKMKVKGMSEHRIHKARHEAWVKAIKKNNNYKLNHVLTAHKEIVNGFKHQQP